MSCGKSNLMSYVDPVPVTLIGNSTPAPFFFSSLSNGVSSRLFHPVVICDAVASVHRLSRLERPRSTFGHELDVAFQLVVWIFHPQNSIRSLALTATICGTSHCTTPSLLRDSRLNHMDEVLDGHDLFPLRYGR